MLTQKSFFELKENEEITGFCILLKYEIKTASNGNRYLFVEVKDKTKNFTGNMWSGFEEVAKELKLGSLIKIKAKVQSFNNNLNFNIEKLRLAISSDNVDYKDFLPNSDRSIDEMKFELLNFISSINNPHLKTLLQNIFTEELLNKYAYAPAAKNWHHAYISGLIEHTLEILKICDLMCSFHAEINRDLLLCGAIFHDLGKLIELDVNYDIHYTDTGKLIGHIVLGAIEIEKQINSIPDFPEKLKAELLHLILSHQGKLEFASPVLPKTLEAIVLYQADELSAKANAYKNAMKNKDATAGNWTKFINLAGTDLYIRDYEL